MSTPLARGGGIRNNTGQLRLVWFFTDRRSAVRNSLVAALVACANSPNKTLARRFLMGLSADELQFIAGYLGGHILECGGACPRTREELAERVGRVPNPRAPRIAADLELKMILLREYLCRAGVKQLPAGVPNHAVN
jgi:hypothetical protein